MVCHGVLWVIVWCPWWKLPLVFGVWWQTVHRWYGQWTRAGLWRRPDRAVLDWLCGEGILDWSCAVVDTASVRAKPGLNSVIGAGVAAACTPTRATTTVTRR
jgi:hypothetical protein